MFYPLRVGKKSSLAVAAVLLILSMSIEYWQSSQGQSLDKNPKAEKETKKNAPDPSQRQALWILDRAWESSRNFEDVLLKVRIQARIADSLWDYDEPRARSLFQDAFRIVVTTKTASTHDGTQQPRLPRIEWLLQARSEILRLVTQHDPEMVKSMIKSLEDQIPDTDSRRSYFNGLNERARLQMGLATNIAGIDPESATRIAREALARGIDPALTGLLKAIRMKDPGMADSLFTYALSVARRHKRNAYTSIRLLAPYVFARDQEADFYAYFGDDYDAQPLPPPNPTLILQFLDFAYYVIIENLDAKQSSASNAVAARTTPPAAFDYLTIKQFLPHFDQHMPDRAATIRARIGEVAQLISIQDRDSLDGYAETESVDDLLRKAQHAQNSREKDRLYLHASQTALRQGDFDQAISIAAKIENERIRSNCDSIVRRQASVNALKHGDVDLAYTYARDLPDLISRATVFKLIIQSLIKKEDFAKAAEMTNSGERLIGKSEEGHEKAQALLIIAEAAARLDQINGFEVMRSAVNAINRAEFTSDWHNNTLRNEDKSKSGSKSRIAFGLNALNFNHGFPLLAQYDFDGAMLLAQSLKSKEASVLAQIAICRGALTKLSSAPARNKNKEPDQSSEKKTKDTPF